MSSRMRVTPCPSWCDRSHEGMAVEGDLIHTTSEYVFDGLFPGEEVAFLLAEQSSDYEGLAVVSVNGVKFNLSDARRVAIQILELAEIAESQ